METTVACILIIVVFVMVLNALVTLKLIRGLLCIECPQKTNSSQLQRVRVPAEHDDREEGKDLHLSD